MHDQIDKFLEKMDSILTNDMISYIGVIIYKSLNLDIIRKQKELKILLNKEIFYKFNVVYNDDNILLYMNNENKCMLHNNPNANQSLYLYSNSMQQPQDALTTLTHDTANNDISNDIVLFQDAPAQRRIKLYIVYI